MHAYSFPLFVPATRPDRFAKAAMAGSDTIIVDLEDAVNDDGKDDARSKAGKALGDIRGVDVWLRVNGSETSWYEHDVELAVASGVGAVVLPKAESPGQLKQLRGSLGSGQAVVALIETAKGLRAVYEIAEVSDRLIFGSIDFALDIGCQPTREACLLARSTLVVASRAARIAAPLDGVTTHIGEEAVIRSDAEHANGLGFGGKLLIHPEQIASARAGFAPPPEEVTWARKVLAGGEGGEARSVDGEMIDAPLVERARTILRKAGETE
ncbi:HpcH/HpaI aldolase/citrate lyase family protein [Henriciella aquimarina]|uniref:HpcH/HpaI aldolase/citrate lyase family protein n=1 Tax=Henriciella aquimarina TaxID=545261 RepID=UPI0009FBED7E|nr:CoA ester lyase [Henriciella aquimarina]